MSRSPSPASGFQRIFPATLFATGFQRPPLSHMTLAGLGGGIGIGALGALSILSGSALLMAPLGATAVLVFGLPDSPLSQARHVIGGHALAMGVGLLCLFLFGNGLAGIAIGSGLAIGLMLATRTVHPPAGANPLLLMLTGAGAGDAALHIALPGVAGAAFLYVIARLTNRLAAGPAA